MQTADGNLFTRSDTMFGVCQGLGEDLGFNPNIIRVVMGGLIFWNPVAAIGLYLGLGVVVAVTRFLYPVPTLQEEPAAEAQPEAAAEREPEPAPMQIAA